MSKQIQYDQLFRKVINQMKNNPQLRNRKVVFNRGLSSKDSKINKKAPSLPRKWIMMSQMTKMMKRIKKIKITMTNQNNKSKLPKRSKEANQMLAAIKMVILRLLYWKERIQKLMEKNYPKKAIACNHKNKS